MDRSFKYFTIAATNTPQPLIGTTLSAAVVPTPDNDAFTAGTAITSLPVVDSSMFQPGDYLRLTKTDGTSPEGLLKVFKVPDATHVQVQGMTSTRVSGDFVALTIPCSLIYVQPKDGGAGAIGIGNAADCNLTTGVHLRVILQKVAAGSQPIDWNSSRTSAAPNPINSGDLWIVGTNPDTYLPSLGLV